MPKAGYKSITINGRIYDDMYRQYTKHANHLMNEGVFSGSGFITRMFYLGLKEWEKSVSEARKK